MIFYAEIHILLVTEVYMVHSQTTLQSGVRGETAVK